jgi:hypothetical protein
LRNRLNQLSANIVLLFDMRFAFLILQLFLAGELVAGMPAGLSRFNPAGLSNDWAYEGIAFEVLARPSPSAPLPVLRLQHPKRGYLLTNSEAAARRAESEGFVREGVAFYAPVQSNFPVHQFRNRTTSTYLYSPPESPVAHEEWLDDGLAFYAYAPPAGATTPGKSVVRDVAGAVNVARYRNVVSGNYLFTAGHESPYQVGAFYFGTFSPNGLNIITGTERVYARRNDWWGGVEDFYGLEPGIRKDTRGWSGDWSYLKPAIGYYNQQVVTTLEKHIHQASDAGLSFFSFYWYPSKGDVGESLAEGLHSFLAAKNSSLLKFNLALYSHPWADDMAIDSGNAQAVARLVVSYFTKTNYLRLPDGQPVFIIGDHRNIRGADGKKCADTRCYVKALESFVALLKTTSIQEIGIAPFVQIQQSGPGWEIAAGIDGTTCIIPPTPIQSATPYPELGDAVFTSLTRAGRPVSPCIFENFDERPRQDILVSDRSAIRYLIGKTDTLFRQNLMSARNFSDRAYAATGSPVARIVYLYAWNEWHEGGIVEPNIQSGARDLNIVTDVFQLPRVASPCLDQNAC